MPDSAVLHLLDLPSSKYLPSKPRIMELEGGHACFTDLTSEGLGSYSPLLGLKQKVRRRLDSSQ